MVSLRYSPPFRHKRSPLQTQVTILKNGLGSNYFSVKFLFKTKQCPSLESDLTKLIYQAPLEGKARWACGHKCCSNVYYTIICSFPWPLFSTSGGWYFNKTLSLAENSFNLSFSSCVLVARHNGAGPLSAGNFHVHWFVLLTYGWNRAITEKKKHGC